MLGATVGSSTPVVTRLLLATGGRGGKGKGRGERTNNKREIEVWTHGCLQCERVQQNKNKAREKREEKRVAVGEV
jgi:hypothetical protein